MIEIRILNSRELIRSQKGWFVAKIAPLFKDVDKEVENIVIREIKAELAEQGIEAEVTRRTE